MTDWAYKTTIVTYTDTHLILLCIWINQNALGQIIDPMINIESVRKDIISHSDFMFPEEYIKTIEQDKFNVFYLDDYCLVHIAYKNVDTHSSEKFSHIVVYSLKDKTWIYHHSIPYYYNLTLINTKEKIFFSNNLFCGMNGICNRLAEISRFDEHDLVSIVRYEGYNNTLYYDRLIVFEKYKEVLKTIGDTICNDFIISEIETNENGLVSYGLTQKIVILKDLVSDSLQTVDNKNYNRVIYKP